MKPTNRTRRGGESCPENERERGGLRLQLDLGLMSAMRIVKGDGQ